ncbi:gallinacin-8-like isoform X2 [Falco biarmicus]|uniref:Beta-defensin-like domain-containing protein n=1 Tax=Falco tinnunculus TaxID=100819 RepID=A0A8C4TUX9_FALTI|nr:gallinacin-8-like isoform X2 [Falco peregrinus]XP_027667340.1 gallinacin-8-like isoform X2 [Falco cherrug]XP_037247434.1 gallinacin-8-like isoform X2 [Falco rusticolus]XP_040455388.1 gallinacin-8-like isoform X2 [Falco naumanni]XP_056199461.1 gallinacin-8-like isoform X2 [Falco biarmicus]
MKDPYGFKLAEDIPSLEVAQAQSGKQEERAILSYFEVVFWRSLTVRSQKLSSELLYLVALNLDMKIFSLFLAVLLLMLQGSSGFMRAPNNHVQCKQAGGTCSADHCPLPNTRFFGRCQQGVPCCRTVYD